VGFLGLTAGLRRGCSADGSVSLPSPEAIRCHGRVPDRALDIPVPEVGLKAPRILALVGIQGDAENLFREPEPPHLVFRAKENGATYISASSLVAKRRPLPAQLPESVMA
jgi:hypothetical protein